MVTNLHEVPAGESVRIGRVTDDEVRARLLRMGFLDGEIECRRRIRRGPVVVASGGTELALGRSVARDIEVTRTGKP